jgi:outer membrane lipoprotein-sorting protein
VTKMPEPKAVEQDHWRDLQPLLDQELSRLPDKYRVPIVLCDLEGKTRKEAARQLGVPEGTVAGRLARARVILAKRLTRHGLALSAGTLAVVLSEKVASAAVPTLVVSSTIKAVTSVAAGQAAGAGVISAEVAALTEGVVKTMLLSKIKTLLAVLFVLWIVAFGAGLYMHQAGAQQGRADKSLPVATKDDGTAEKGAPEALPAKEGDRPKAKADNPSAKQIVDRMAKAYADCKTYRDSGGVKTLFVQDSGNRTVTKPFTTAFVRPDRFRFEYKETIGDQQMRYIISSNEKEVQTWWDVKPGIEKPESLNLALGAAVGVSSFSSNNIPALLLPDKVNPRRLLMLTEPKRAEDAKLDKVECFRVEGTFGGNPITLWIDKKSYLVRRIDEQAKFDNFRTEQTTTYDPTIDEQITDKMLKFDPPAPK